MLCAKMAAIFSGGDELEKKKTSMLVVENGNIWALGLGTEIYQNKEKLQKSLFLIQKIIQNIYK